MSFSEVDEPQSFNWRMAVYVEETKGLEEFRQNVAIRDLFLG